MIKNKKHIDEKYIELFLSTNKNYKLFDVVMGHRKKGIIFGEYDGYDASLITFLTEKFMEIHEQEITDFKIKTLVEGILEIRPLLNYHIENEEPTFDDLSIVLFRTGLVGISKDPANENKAIYYIIDIRNFKPKKLDI